MTDYVVINPHFILYGPALDGVDTESLIGFCVVARKILIVRCLNQDIVH